MILQKYWSKKMRQCAKVRKTAETEITVNLNIDNEVSITYSN